MGPCTRSVSSQKCCLLLKEYGQATGGKLKEERCRCWECHALHCTAAGKPIGHQVVVNTIAATEKPTAVRLEQHQTHSPSVRRARPPVGVHRTVEQLPQSTTVCASKHTDTHMPRQNTYIMTSLLREIDSIIKC